jgi:hypothetical protein
MKTFSLNPTGVLLLVLVFVSVSCKKQRIERKYTGDFTFTVYAQTWNMSSGNQNYTYTYDGHIEIDEDVYNHYSGLSEKDTFLKIYFLTNGGYKNARVDVHGKFSHFGASGGFDNRDELYCVMTHQALSSSSTYTIQGVRR